MYLNCKMEKAERAYVTKKAGSELYCGYGGIYSTNPDGTYDIIMDRFGNNITCKENEFIKIEKEKR